MMPRPRVLLCCEHYSPSVGGVQEVMRQIAERLAVRGFEVCVATGSHPRRPADTVINGVRVISFSIKGNLVKGMTGPVAEYQLFLKDGEFDSILIKAAQQWTFDAAVDVIPLMRARKVFIPCGFSGLYEPVYSAYFKKMPEWLRRFDALVFYSEAYQDIEFARTHNLKQLHLIPNGVDELEFEHAAPGDIRSELGIAEDDDLLLSVGSLIMAKGHWEVVRAFREVQLQRPATLVINGNHPHGGLVSLFKRGLKHALTGRWPMSLEAAMASLLPSKRVLITNLPRHKLVQLYSASNIFVFASHIEYSPLVLFEAAASGTPFIASDAGNSREIAAWTGAGVIISRRNDRQRKCEVSDLSKAIESMLADPGLNSLGAAGRQTVLYKGFTWDKIVERYIDVLNLPSSIAQPILPQNQPYHYI